MTPPITCLLVDDREDNLLMLAALLRRDGLELLTACSGAEALELLLVHDVALAFIDVQMPEMDGFELAELMRGSERTRRIPIIFVTAGNREASRQFRGYDLGAVDFLYKPVDPFILESKAAVFFELHRQKQLLAHELRQRSETLQLNEMFTAVLGHDLRNPLNAIVMAASLLQRRAQDQETTEIARRILLSGSRMTRMIEDMLDLTRARLAGGIPLKRTSADLAVVVDRVVHELRIAHPARTIDVIIDGDVTGEWDRDRLLQIASNLIGNAVQHGASGPVTVRLQGDAADTMVLSVTNVGIIPPEVMPELFTPFRSGQRERSQGLGLGLYIAQQIAYAHDGEIVVTSGPDGGTTFTLTLPRRVTRFATF